MAANDVIGFEADDTTGFVNILVYGPFGVGKTVLAATAQQCPETANVLFASAESGHSSIIDFGIRGVDIYKINTFKQFNKFYEFARRHALFRDEYVAAKDGSPEKLKAKEGLCKAKVALFAKEGATAEQLTANTKVLMDDPKEPKLYRTVVLDSITEIQKYAMYHILGIDINTVSLDTDIPMAKIQDWGKSAEMIRMLVRAFRDLKMNTIICALDMKDKDETDGSVSILPSLPGKLAVEVCGFLDIVGYLYVKPGPTKDDPPKRIMLTAPVGKFNAKSRYKALGTHIEDPTITKIMSLITGKQLTPGNNKK